MEFIWLSDSIIDMTNVISKEMFDKKILTNYNDLTKSSERISLREKLEKKIPLNDTVLY